MKELSLFSGAGGGLRKLEDQISIDVGKNNATLNPDWVEWLMGWPALWSDLAPIKNMCWLSWDKDPADNGDITRVTTKKENRINRLKAIGNGQVPQVAATAWRILNNGYR